jgi:hypothetical protein
MSSMEGVEGEPGQALEGRQGAKGLAVGLPLKEVTLQQHIHALSFTAYIALF